MKPKPRKLIFLIATLAALVTICTMALYWQPLFAWYEFQCEFETLPVNAQGLPEYKHRQTGIIFVKIPGGTFMMGSPEDEVGQRIDEGPIHEVKLSNFLIGKYEITQAQWMEIMGNNPSHFKGDHLPVENVSWVDCKLFCNKTEFSLPTEAQWEYACRSGSLTPFSFGTALTDEHANFNGKDFSYLILKYYKFRGKTISVDQLKSNDFGLKNMHGNVFEWCLEDYQSYQDSSQASINGDIPQNISADSKIFRGGSWRSPPAECRSAFRGGNSSRYKSNQVGFRPVRNLE